MRDNLIGGLLAVGIAAPVVIVCCGGGAAFLVAVSGGITAWLSGLAGISTALVAALAFLVVRDVRRAIKRRPSNESNSLDRKTQT